MADFILNIEPTWEEELNAELEKEMANVSSALNHAMGMVGELMLNSLKKHIDEDVYKAYTPQSYLRRKDNPQFGRALNDFGGSNLRPIFDYQTQGNKIGIRTGIDYTPDGFNSATTADLDPYDSYYDADNPKPIKPIDMAVHGNALIRRIETGKGYDWKPPKSARKSAKKYAKEHGTPSTGFPPRPFWQNFVDEMTNDGEMGITFKMAMLERGYAVDMEDGVTREPNDGVY